jgi:hypothetical protein
MNRIVLTQPSHTAAWNTPAGHFYLIVDGYGDDSSGKARRELGEEFLANIIAERQCILQVHESCSMRGAARKYHNPDSPAFKSLLAEMRQGGGQPIYHGPELLLFVHGHGLATFLLAHGAAQKQFEKLKTQAHGKQFQFWPVVKFSAYNISTRQIRFFSPLLTNTDLTWTQIQSVNSQRVLFENASFKREPLAPTPQAAVRKFSDAVQDMRRSGVKIARREFNRLFENLVQQANDGDYGIDELDSMSQSDFH